MKHTPPQQVVVILVDKITRNRCNFYNMVIKEEASLGYFLTLLVKHFNI